MNKYEPKSGFIKTYLGDLVYNLMPNGTCRNGQEEWVNDVAISIRAHHLTPEQRKDIADTIQSVMNAKYLPNKQIDNQ